MYISFFAIHGGASGLLTQARRGGINGPTTISILYQRCRFVMFTIVVQSVYHVRCVYMQCL